MESLPCCLSRALRELFEPSWGAGIRVKGLNFILLYSLSFLFPFLFFFPFLFRSTQKKAYEEAFGPYASVHKVRYISVAYVP